MLEWLATKGGWCQRKQKRFRLSPSFSAGADSGQPETKFLLYFVLAESYFVAGMLDEIW